MPENNEEKRAYTRDAIRRPVRWIKGSHLPEEQVRPWEMAVHILPNITTGIRDGFTWNTMYLFQNVFKLNKRQQAVAKVTGTLWDGANDPVIGAYMDSKNYPIRLHRWIMRITILVNNLFNLLPMFSFGMTPWQHVIVYIAVTVFNDPFGTARTVSERKIWAHITPRSAERAKIAWAYNIGLTLHEMLGALYLVVIGLREVLGWSEYSIYLFGAVLFTLPSLFLEMGPSFVLQRVPDTQKPSGEAWEQKKFFQELRECFVVVRHNRYLLLDLAARFITVFTPGLSDNDFYRYCGVDEVLRTGRIKGEFLLWIRNNVMGAPGTLLQPFSLPIIKKVGGARNMQVLYRGGNTLVYLLRYLVGMKSQFGVLFSWGMDTISWTLDKVARIAEDIIKYDMLDYVEWKTGRRTEGITAAMDGLMRKMVTNNIDVIVGNLVVDAIGFDPNLQKQPAKFMQWAPILYLAVPVFDSLIYFLARLLYKYPASLREQVEADLITRRKLAEQAETVPTP